MQTSAGLAVAPVPLEACAGLRGREPIWTDDALDAVLQSCAACSDRVANGIANRLLNRSHELDEVPLRTMVDLVAREGEALLSEQAGWARDVLAAHGWDPGTQLPTPAAELAPLVGALDPSSYAPPPGEAHRKRVDDAIAHFNERRDDARERVPEGLAKAYGAEPDESSAVYLSLDGVGAKRQKDSRPKTKAEPEFVRDGRDGPPDYSRPPEPRRRPKVETAVAHVECDGRRYVLVAESMFAVVGAAIALMLELRLLEGRRLVVLSDGGVDIRSCASRLLPFCSPTVILDWYHLRKHCCELLSMALKGGKANRPMQYEVKRRLFRMLWAGNVGAACTYLLSLGDAEVKCRKRLEDLVGYLRAREPQIACYAVRRELGLRVSSNRVEKANDLVVASRQKHKGMSWSRQGSWSLGAVTALYLNRESASWRSAGRPRRVLQESYGAVFELVRNELPGLPAAA